MAANAQTTARLLRQIIGAGNLVCLVRTEETFRVTSGHISGVGATLPAALRNFLDQVEELERAADAVYQPLTKVCARCKAEHPLEDFPRDASRPDGRFPSCYACERPRWRKKDRQRRKRTA